MEHMKFFTVIIIIICRGLLTIMNQTNVSEPACQKDVKESAYQAEDTAISNQWCACDLAAEEWPDYYFFTNAQQGHYNLSLENAAAFAVKDYAHKAGMKTERWELKQIYDWRDDIYLAYVESDMRSELYMLLKTDTPDTFPLYIIAADIRKGDAADTALYEEYSYNSVLEWHSYEEWIDGKMRGEQLQIDIRDEIYDPIYNNGVVCAIYDYTDMTDKDLKVRWEIDGNDTYIGNNGYVVCANCSNGVQNIIFFVDVWNKTYAVWR